MCVCVCISSVLNLQLFLILLHKLCEPYDLFTFVNPVNQASNWEGGCWGWVATSSQERTFSLEAQSNDREQSRAEGPPQGLRKNNWLKIST